ncbi:MAG: tetratricopeptide repeat protein [Flavobacteriales bacterium]|nr:tetratricopeptide repeat protein [Flavobacteriales bacterium]
MNKLVFFTTLLITSFVFSQTKEEKARAMETQELLSKANSNLKEGNFPEAEAGYRKIIANEPKNATAKYNLGNAYYKNKKNREAIQRYIQAAEVATTKPEKHKIYHNLGNSLMNDKNYRGAVEAYKNALRNNPTDDETRYNLALAKKMLEEQGDDGGEDEEDKKDQDQEQQEDQEDEGDGDSEDKDQDQDKGDEGEEDKDSKENEDNGDTKENQNKPEQQQPVPGQLSPQQIQSLLEAMNNEERKVQDKINAEKQKGVITKPEKDW